MQVDEEEIRIFQALTLSFGWLTKRELCSVSTLNSDFLVAARQDYPWQPTLLELEEVYLHDSAFYRGQEVYYPLRICGELRDAHSCLPHPRDKGARRVPEHFVLASERCSSVMKIEDGKLYDCFYRARDPIVLEHVRSAFSGELFVRGPVREEIWLPRDFPIHCVACGGVTLDDKSEMFHHCCTLITSQELRLKKNGSNQSLSILVTIQTTLT